METLKLIVVGLVILTAVFGVLLFIHDKALLFVFAGIGGWMVGGWCAKAGHWFVNNYWS